MKAQQNAVTASGKAPKIRPIENLDLNRGIGNHWIKSNVARFNFTYALDGGAWLQTKDLDGLGTKDTNWFSASIIDRILGKGEFQRLFRKQGMFTGCWIDV